MTNTNNNLSGWGGKTRWRWPSLTNLINIFFQCVRPKWHSYSELANDSCFLSTNPLFFYFVLVYSCCNFLYVQIEDLVKFLYLDISRVPCDVPSLSGYQYPWVDHYIYCLNPDTTNPIGSPWYLCSLLSQELTFISLILSWWPCDVLHKWGYFTSPYN